MRITRQTLGNLVVHAATGGLIFDAINNTLHGNYEMASVEMILGAYLETQRHLVNQRRQIVQGIINSFQTDYIPRLERTDQALHELTRKIYDFNLPK